MLRIESVFSILKPADLSSAASTMLFTS